jgi:hypothetical protein
MNIAPTAISQAIKGYTIGDGVDFIALLQALRDGTSDELKGTLHKTAETLNTKIAALEKLRAAKLVERVMAATTIVDGKSVVQFKNQSADAGTALKADLAANGASLPVRNYLSWTHFGPEGVIDSQQYHLASAAEQAAATSPAAPITGETDSYQVRLTAHPDGTKTSYVIDKKAGVLDASFIDVLNLKVTIAAKDQALAKAIGAETVEVKAMTQALLDSEGEEKDLAEARANEGKKIESQSDGARKNLADAARKKAAEREQAKLNEALGRFGDGLAEKMHAGLPLGDE